MGGRRYPEIDRVQWMGPDLARVKLNPALGVFIDRLLSHLSVDGNNPDDVGLDAGVEQER
jgi:predicted NUDIX family NTP pyrophosphohydrolase